MDNVACSHGGGAGPWTCLRGRRASPPRARADPRLDLRGDRRHPAGAAQPAAGRGRLPGRGPGQARVLQPAVLGQGPHRAGHGRGRGARGQAARRQRDRRADLRQHRHRAGLRLRRQGLPPDPDHAREHVDRAPQDAQAAGRRARADAGRAGHARRACGGRAHPRRASRRDHAAAVREPGQPGDPPPHHGRGDLARHRRPAGRASSPASAPAARSPAAPRR